VVAAGAAVVAALAVAALVVAAAVGGRGDGPVGPVATPWSSEYAVRFEAACAATGASAAYCRCARVESERRIPEPDMLRLQREIGRGGALREGDRRTLHDVEVLCGR
jgi:hypothetical protein